MEQLKKLCILIDPDKPEAYEVAKACVEAKDLINEYAEVWVGTSKTNFKTINDYTKMLRDGGISGITLFPGKLDHVLCYKHVKQIFGPTLLNCTKWYMHMYAELGKSLAKLFDLFYRKQKTQEYGYLTIGPNSTVGRKLGSLPLTDEEIISRVKKFSENFPFEKGIYFEAGSGAKKPVSLEVIKESRKILPENMEIIVGGGINSVEEVKEFFNSGADKVVVGTFFERNPREIRKFIKRLYDEQSH